MKINNLIISALFLLPAPLWAQNSTFSHEEQTQISVVTPGLFDRSTAFSVDFGQMKQSEFSFPLPVGKVDGIRTNNNIVISSKEGDNIKAMFAGTVRLSRNFPTWGNVVVVRHDNGLETVYGNNLKNIVKVGDRVKAGQTVALVGTRDGKSFCEFALMVNGARINPETMFDLSSYRLRHQTLLFQQSGKNVIIKVITEEKEQTLQKIKGRKQAQRGNMTKQSNKTVKEETTASSKYSKDSQHVAQQQDDNATFDIDEYQALQLEEKVKKYGNAKQVNEFTVNFAGMNESQWAYPLKGAHVISPYGGKRHHAGTDIKRQPGDPIYAAFDGQVVLSGTHFGYGLCIVIRHSNGFETLYSHQSKNSVKVGDWVKAGQQIGIVGRTGRATTEHCHFEMRCNGRPFDSSRVWDHSKNTLKSVILNYKNGKVYISNATSSSKNTSVDEDDEDDEEEVTTPSKSGSKSSKHSSKKSKKKSKKHKKRRR